MLGADVVVAEAERFGSGESHHSLGLVGEGGVGSGQDLGRVGGRCRRGRTVPGFCEGSGKEILQAVGQGFRQGRAFFGTGDGFDQFGPAGKAVLAGEDELGLLQGEIGLQDLLGRGVGQAREVGFDALGGCGIAGAVRFVQTFGLLLEVLEIGTWGQLCGHGYPLSGIVPDVRRDRQKEGLWDGAEGGLGPYRGRGGSLVSTVVNY